MNAAKLLQFFDERSARGEPLVLATVYETEGSTYSKAGDHMLIDQNGIFRGMLSGGCLEGDLAVRAQVVIESGQAQTASYDLANDDDIWGLGVGCDGLMRIFLQPLLPNKDYAPFGAIAEVLRGGQRAALATVIESTNSQLVAGASVVVVGETVAVCEVSDPAAAVLRPAAIAALDQRTTRCAQLAEGDQQMLVLCNVVEPPPNVLILGAGLDAEPLVTFCIELGWRCTVVDHRPAYIASGNFSSAFATHCVPTDALSTTINLSQYDVAIVMSHHLASDRSYLAQLADTNVRYVGLLGPLARRERLLAELGPAAEKLRERVFGPAGLDLGGRGPAPIALSIIAQVQKVLACD